MKFAYDVPGFVQGHRFSSDARYYDAANSRFRDLAGYDRFGNGVEKTAGTPAFSLHGARQREGLLLDNTCQWQFVPAIPWEGTVVLVFKPIFASGATMSIYPWIFGDAASVASNGKIRLGFFSGTRSINCETPSVQLASSISGLVSGNIAIAVFGTSQADRIMRRTQDGVTVSASAALGGTTNGNGVALGGGGLGNTLGGRMVRLGNNSGVAGDVTQNTTDYLYVFEQHFFKGDALTQSLPQIKGLIDSLKSYYGI